MVEELPVVRTLPARRRYVLRGRRQSHPIRWMAFWVTSAAFGLTVGYAILLYGFHADPLAIGGMLPKVSVEWPASGLSG
jgi:hypothetical protein